MYGMCMVCTIYNSTVFMFTYISYMQGGPTQAGNNTLGSNGSWQCVVLETLPCKAWDRSEQFESCRIIVTSLPSPTLEVGLGWTAPHGVDVMGHIIISIHLALTLPLSPFIISTASLLVLPLFFPNFTMPS